LVEFVDVKGLRIGYETFGDDQDEAMVLLSGLGGEMRDWSDEAVSQLVGAGFYVVRVDHRDSGVSSTVEVPVDIISAFLGNKAAASYTLMDMAADVKAVIEHLEIVEVHMVGASMGAMVAQQFCISYPDSALSLASIMSTTGSKSVGQPSKEVVEALLNGIAPEMVKGKASKNEASSLTPYVLGVEADIEDVRDHLKEATAIVPSMDRILRQLAAIFVSGDRTQELKRLAIPTVVIHGDSDPVVDVSGGVATHEAVRGSKLVIIPGMGHEVNADNWPLIRDEIIKNAKTKR
jgi:pimeloyl-ACP methyl ester carboxylesterase